jgi:hypothetical protein
MEGEKMKSHQKGYFWNWSVFLLSEYCLPFYLKIGAFLFLPFLFPFFNNFSLSSFFVLRFLRTWRFWWYLRRKSILQKPLFKWHDMEWHGHDCGYTGGGRIFRNRVMYANIGKPWLWRCGNCRYISGGRIFWSWGMHTNISGWG